MPIDPIAQGGAEQPGFYYGALWRSPLVPVAVAFTTGILVDRAVEPAFWGSLFATVVFLITWGIVELETKPGLPLIYLLLAIASSGAAYHHYRHQSHPRDDIGWRVEEGSRIVQVRGVLAEEPRPVWVDRDDPLRSSREYNDESTPTISLLLVRHIKEEGEWSAASGIVLLFVNGRLQDLHSGDRVELVGQLTTLPKADNPGERDYRRALSDNGVRALLQVKHSADVVTRLESRSSFSPSTWIAELRGWSARQFGNDFPRHGALTAALVLGDGNALSPKDWDKYVRTGVIHVLVVSGQHLVVLAAFLWFCLRFTPLRYNTSAILIVLILWVYAILTGGRPPVMRAAATITVFAGGLLLRRPTLPLNALAAAWLFVLLLNPADVADLGCLLSFACVAVLYWDFDRREARKKAEDPLDALIEQSRPAWERALRAVGRAIVYSYVVGTLLWIVTTPLAVRLNHYVPLAGLLIGPPVILCTSLALIGGFLVLLSSALLPFLTPVFVWATSGLLSLCDTFVDMGLAFSPRHLHIPDIPSWWIIGFYALLASSLLIPHLPLWRRRGVFAGVAWVVVGAVAMFVRLPTDELRVTFLAIGHGGCTVIETPDGRTILYDIGSLRGPGVVKAKIAPYLWHRGIRRIDELILSHADLDHYNGLRDLMDRFPIGRITLSPTFGQKVNPAVRYVFDLIDRSDIPIARVALGDRLHAGKASLDVLHPPEAGLEGIENVRSLVMLVRLGRHRVLLTGDLEGDGLATFLRQQARSVDVLMAPHHGSRRLDVEGLLRWARPSLIVSCQDERPAAQEDDPYRSYKKRFLETSSHGAITLRLHTTGIVVETHATKQGFVLRSSHRDDE